LAVSASRRLTF
jgi:hypothetical protein